MINNIISICYKDPENVEELIEKIRTFPTIKEIYEFINEIYPTWIIIIISKYCKDYSIFDKNWKDICALNGSKQQAIIIIDDMIFDNEHKLIGAFAEVLTSTGFVLRRKLEFSYCTKCLDAVIPTEELYNKIKDKNNIPLKWSSHCINC